MSIIKQETATMALSSNEGVGGTPAYMAPETTGIIEPVQLSTKLDVFSFGMLLYELAERNIPFKGMNPVAITTSILQGRRPEFKNKTGETAHPAWIYMLIEACWAQDRSQRPLIDEVRRMIESETCPQLSSVNTLASQNVQTNDNNNNSYSNTQPNISMSGSSSPKSQLKHTPLLRASLHEDSQNEVKRPNITSVIHEVDTAGTAKTCLSQQEKVVATESKTIIIEKTSDQSQPDEKSPSKSGISITDSEDIKIPSTSEKKKKKNRKWLFILGGCACVTILAAVVGIIASSTSPNSDEDDKKENEQINQTTPSPTPEPSPAPTFDPASCFEFLGSLCRDEDNGFAVDTSTTVCERPDSDCSLEECMEICNNNDDCQGIEFTRRERSSDKNFVCEIHTNIGKQHSRNTGGKESGRDVCYGKKECS